MDSTNRTSSDDTTTTIDLNDILAVAKKAARLAGAHIRQAMIGHRRADTTIKSDTTDLVTETDQACEALITEIIQQQYPGHCIIGEESSGADCQYELTDAPT